MVVETLCRQETPATLWPAADKPAEAEWAELPFHAPIKVWPVNDAPTTRPVALIDNRQSLCHVLHVVDEETPKHNGKPAGIKGVEIWAKMGGAPPVHVDELTILAMDSSDPHVVHFPKAQAGQTAHYLLRWIGQGGEKGPWSQVFSADVQS